MKHGFKGRIFEEFNLRNHGEVAVVLKPGIIRQLTGLRQVPWSSQKNPRHRIVANPLSLVIPHFTSSLNIYRPQTANLEKNHVIYGSLPAWECPPTISCIRYRIFIARVTCRKQ
ncbi:hypothetical protein Zmor_008545 [Zophobas morio]|uniref:Uncharacterized protein n=1 Tax=Zophobas morio TaxID=2755281 RepID=A0AA38IYX4_9CUCU|nr:hypothetical protein Zmor_008545 [Zophobas morio]